MSEINLQDFACTACLAQAEQIQSEPEVVNGQVVVNIQKDIKFCMADQVKIKMAMRGRINWANEQLANGAKTDEINACQPILTQFTEILSDEAEEAWLEQQGNLI